MKTKGTDIQIAVITSGFVYVGNVAIQDGVAVIRNALNIRRWGTTNGLGEIAIGGPTKSTILDKSGTVRVPYHSLIMLIDCEAAPWLHIYD